MTAPILQFTDIGKVFPGVVALADVSMDLGRGEIRALMGENGAGKSTLLKILAGEYRPDSGALTVNGRAVAFNGPRDSAGAGIAIIHQELHLAPDMSVADNLLLGAYPGRLGLVDGRAVRARARAILARLGEDIDPDAKVKTLPIGKRQMVEIGKALLRDAAIIAFDEPTSSLSARETETLMRIIRDLKADGRAILYVSHRMEEVFALCDSVSILRDGRHVATYPDMRQTDPDHLIAQMAGRTIADVYGYQSRELGPVSLELSGVTGPGVKQPVSLSARRGEILGFFGLVGAGRSELFKLIYGAAPLASGTISLDGAPRRFATPRHAIAAGLGLCPEDRKDEGIFKLAAVRENITITRRNMEAAPLIRRQEEAGRAEKLIGSMRVKTASADTAVGTLSGGNQQKAILARWLDADARFLLMDEPTRGIDIGARSEIYALMYRLAAEGKTLLVASSDMPEVMGVADRIVVMRDGAIAGVLTREEATPNELLRLALPDGKPVGAAVRI